MYAVRVKLTKQLKVGFLKGKKCVMYEI